MTGQSSKVPGTKAETSGFQSSVSLGMASAKTDGMKIPLLVSTIALCLLPGCETTGLSRHDGGPESYTRLANALPANNLQPMAPGDVRFPMRLAVGQIGEVSQSKEVLDAFRAHPQYFSSVISIPIEGIRGNQYAGVSERARALARASGADALLITGGRFSANNTKSALSLLELAVVPGYFFPTRKMDVDLQVSGVLLDCETGKLITHTSAHSKSSFATPAYVAHDWSEAHAENQRGALAKELADSLALNLRSVVLSPRR